MALQRSCLYLPLEAVRLIRGAISSSPETLVQTATAEILLNGPHVAVGLLPPSCCTTFMVLCGIKVLDNSHFFSSLNAAILVSVAPSFVEPVKRPRRVRSGQSASFLIALRMKVGCVRAHVCVLLGP